MLHVSEAEQHGKALGEYGGPPCPGNASVKQRHKHKVQRQVGTHRSRQEKKGGPGVPRSPEDGAAEVIKKGCHKPAENNDQISLCRYGNFGRCPYHLEYTGQGQYPKDADGSCKYTARYQGGEKFPAKPPLVAAAVKLRQDNGYTGAEPIDDKDKKVHDRTGNTR